MLVFRSHIASVVVVRWPTVGESEGGGQFAWPAYPDVPGAAVSLGFSGGRPRRRRCRLTNSPLGGATRPERPILAASRTLVRHQLKCERVPANIGALRESWLWGLDPTRLRRGPENAAEPYDGGGNAATRGRRAIRFTRVAMNVG